MTTSGSTRPVDLPGGELLLSAEPTRNPPDLCRRWDIRFLNSSSFAGDTEIVFFIPDNRGGSTPVATGKVYSEAGDFRPDDLGRVFRRGLPSNEQGSVGERRFHRVDVPRRRRGHVSTIHRGGGVRRHSRRLPPAPCPISLSVTKNLCCFPTSRSIEQSGRGDHPLRRPQRNGSRGPGPLRIPLRRRHSPIRREQASRRACDTDGQPARHSRADHRIRAHHGGPGPVGTRTPEQILSGDYIRLAPLSGSPSDLAAGSALADTDPERSPRQLCRRWDVRFIQNPNTGRETVFVFFLDAPTSEGPPVVTGKVFRKNGGLPVKTISLMLPWSLSRNRLRTRTSGWKAARALSNRAISTPGHVATLFKSEGNFGTILVPGVCRDPR